VGRWVSRVSKVKVRVGRASDRVSVSSSALVLGLSLAIQLHTGLVAQRKMYICCYKYYHH